MKKVLTETAEYEIDIKHWITIKIIRPFPKKEQVKTQDIIMHKTHKHNQLNYRYEEKYISLKKAWNIICITNEKMGKEVAFQVEIAIYHFKI
jgi:hypothetical protein